MNIYQAKATVPRVCHCCGETINMSEDFALIVFSEDHADPLDAWNERVLVCMRQRTGTDLMCQQIVTQLREWWCKSRFDDCTFHAYPRLVADRLALALGASDGPFENLSWREIWVKLVVYSHDNPNLTPEAIRGLDSSRQN